MFSWHTSKPVNHRLNASAYLTIVTDHVLYFMDIIYMTVHNATKQYLVLKFHEHDNDS